MTGLTNLEVYNSSFDITEEINKFEFYTQSLHSEFSFTDLKYKVAEALGLSDVSMEDLEQEKHRPDIIITYRNLSMEKS